MVTQAGGFMNLNSRVSFSSSMYIQTNLTRAIPNNAADLSRVFLGRQVLQDSQVFQEGQHPIQV